MKTAIIHYWLVGMRGGEKVVEALCDMFPDADIFTHVYDPAAVSPVIRRHNVTTTFINSLPNARRWYKRYLPLMPLALEQLDLRPYDLIISSESGPAKGIIPPPRAKHLCYCHTPMRYLWNMFHDYRLNAGMLTRLAMPYLAHRLRVWDSVASDRVDHFVGNSATVKDRILRYYRRVADVVWPPVDVDAFAPVSRHDLGDYMLMVGELVPYKRPDLAIDAFNQLKAPLVVIGGGEMLAQCRRIAGPTVRVLGPRPFDELRHYYARCQALVFPGEEDFGIVPVEAMASGRPVIAYGRGGATESVVPGVTGFFFHDQSVAGLIDAVRGFRVDDFEPSQIVANSRRFSRERFTEAMTAQVSRVLAGRDAPVRFDFPLAEPQVTTMSKEADAMS